MATVYILHSRKIDSFYIGSCADIEIRLQQHKENEFSKGFTKRAEDWIVYFKIDNLEYEQSRKIEKHIKSMKSRIYIENLLKYTEITEKLKAKYK